MKTFIKEGNFNSYRNRIVLNESVRREIIYYGQGEKSRRTIFLSHKHDDLKEHQELLGVAGYIEHFANVNFYIDSLDLKMPKKTSGETAKRIKDVIKASDKFILLATYRAIESTWCNWELGFGDAHKYKKDIAILPLVPFGESEYKHHEYLEIYPHIVYYDGVGECSLKGYFVTNYDENNRFKLISIEEWMGL